MELSFKSFQLIFDGSNPVFDDFNELTDEFIDFGDYTYHVKVKHEEKYCFFYARYGKNLPYSDDTLDKKSHKIIKTTRDKDHAELNTQIFAIYDFNYHRFFISNSKKINLFEDYFKRSIHKDIVVKRYLISYDEFIDRINTVESISLTSRKNLFSHDSGLFEDAGDIFGLGQPVELTISASYKGISLTQDLKSRFRDFFRRKKDTNSDIDSLVCIGTEDDGLESVFDIDGYTKQLSINVSKNAEGIFDEHIVFSEILKFLKEKNKA